jgi:hypothetical protein
MYVVVPFLHPSFHVVDNGHVVARFKSRDEAEAHASLLNAAEKARREARHNLWSEDTAVVEAAEKTMLDTSAILRPAWQARHDGVRAAADERFLFRTN